MSFRLRSLSTKLILIYIAVSILAVFLVSATFRVAFRDGFRDNIKSHLELYVEYILEDVGSPPRQDRAQRVADKIGVDIYYQSDSENWSTNNGLMPDLSDIDYWKRTEFAGGLVRFGHEDEHNFAVVRRPEYTLAFVIAGDDDHRDGLMLVPLLTIIALFVGLFFLTRRLFAPLKTINAAMTAFGEGELSRRVSLKRRDELGDVATSFSQMAGRIEQMLESKRQLLLAISHELRSPLTRARVATAMMPDPDLRQEIDAELTEMEALVAELLETERLNAGHKVLNLELLDIGVLADSVVCTINQPIDYVNESVSGDIQGDAARLRLVIRNLLENALKYTPEGAAKPEVSLGRDGEGIVLRVRDHGPGVAAEHIEHLCEPFYRVDPSRQRSTGGYGLGLYLCRMIAEAHGGALTLESKIGVGTTVSLRLPV